MGWSIGKSRGEGEQGRGRPRRRGVRAGSSAGRQDGGGAGSRDGITRIVPASADDGWPARRTAERTTSMTASRKRPGPGAVGGGGDQRGRTGRFSQAVGESLDRTIQSPADDGAGQAKQAARRERTRVAVGRNSAAAQRVAGVDRQRSPANGRQHRAGRELARASDASRKPTGSGTRPRGTAIAWRTSDAIGGEPVGIDNSPPSTRGEERGWGVRVVPAGTGVGGRWASTDHGRSPGSRARGTSGRGWGGRTGSGSRQSAFDQRAPGKKKEGRRHGGWARPAAAGWPVMQ